MEKHITDVLSEWNKSKPIQGTQRPKDAIILINNFEDKFKKLKEDLENIVKAKNALEISDSVVCLTGAQTTSKLEISFEELHDLGGRLYLYKLVLYNLSIKIGNCEFYNFFKTVNLNKEF